MWNSVNRILLVLVLIASVIFLDPLTGYGQKSRKRQNKKDKNDIVSNENNLRLAEQFFTEGEKHFILEDYTKTLVFFEKSIVLAYVTWL